MKKYPTGFVPVNFQEVGGILLVIGVLCVLIEVVDFLVGAFSIPNTVLYFGLASLALSAYLIFIVPK